MKKKLLYVVCAIVLATLTVMLPQIFYLIKKEQSIPYPQSVGKNERYETQQLPHVEPISVKLTEILTIMIPAVFLGIVCWFYAKRKFSASHF